MEIPKLIGLTGSLDTDGYLSIEQQQELDLIQKNTAKTLLSKLKLHKPGDLFPMANMATGIGKGKIIHELISAVKRQNPGAKILKIAGTKSSLVEQSHESLRGYQKNESQNYIEAEDEDRLMEETTDIDEDLMVNQTVLYKTGKYGEPGVDVEIETIQKVVSESRKDSFNPNKYDLVIVDEVHNIGTKSRKSVIELFKSVVGFTATAYRHSGVLRKPEDYGFQIVESLPLPEAQERGLLPPLLGMQLNTAGLVENIPTTISGKIDYPKLEVILKKSPDLLPFISDRLSTILRTEHGVYKTVVAVNFIWEAQKLAELLRNHNFRVGVAINKTQAKEIDSEDIPAVDSIPRYKLPREDERAIDVLISPYVASEGFDAPATEVIVWASPTNSEVRYTQFTGRNARRHPGKSMGVIIDCLYQTSQFNYSMNMAMWMKDDIRVLENGLLYLGPESNIPTLISNVSISSLISESKKDKAILKENLIQESILPIQENETLINIDYLQSTFIGGRASDLRQYRDEAISIISEYYPKLYPKRKTGSRSLYVFTDPHKFIEVMCDLGLKLQRDIPVQPGETVINQKYLESTFVGASLGLRNEALSYISEYYPDLYPSRLNNTSHSPVFTDPNKFIEVMIDLGARLRTLLPIQQGEFPISKEFLGESFIGDVKDLKTKRDEALEIISEYYPDLYPLRTNVTKKVPIFTDPNKFIEVMIDLGIKPRSNILPIQSDETYISQKFLRQTFIGHFGTKLAPLTNEALEIIQDYYPELYPKRKNGSKLSYVFTDPNKFTEVMIDLGAKFRSPD